MKHLLLTLSLASLLYAQSIEESVATKLSAKTYAIAGGFGVYDFADASNAWDWAFITRDGGVYQLQGNEPTQTNVFGWKAVSVEQEIVPSWLMFPLGEDVDGDGSIKFDWVLVGYDAYDGYVFKLSGESDGAFAYSEPIDINYTLDDDNHNVTFGGYATQEPTSDLVLKVYVAGESVESYNNMETLPFNADGTLLSTTDSTQEYGWMLPFYERLKLRDSAIKIEWVGDDCWNIQGEPWGCSVATYTNASIGHNSARAGSTIESWSAENREELLNKEYCYNVAFASRGGNDLPTGVPSTTYKTQLKQLVLDLAEGSNCTSEPVIYVTAHILDAAAYEEPQTQNDITAWLATQKAYYVDIAKEVAKELNTTTRHVYFIDMWTPFYNNSATTAFPNPEWWTTQNGINMPYLTKIHKESSNYDAQHPRRLASIFAGEHVANQIDIARLREILITP